MENINGKRVFFYFSITNLLMPIRPIGLFSMPKKGDDSLKSCCFYRYFNKIYMKIELF